MCFLASPRSSSTCGKNEEENSEEIRLAFAFAGIRIEVLQIDGTEIYGLAACDEIQEIIGELTGVFMGLVVLCLAQYFAYGAQLQEDVDGLV